MDECMRRLPLVSLLFCLAIGLAACGGDDSSDPGGGDGGGHDDSGHVDGGELENAGSVAAKICWTVFYNDSSRDPSDGCKTSMDPGLVERSSCFGCGEDNGGASSIELTKYEPEN